LKHPKQEIRKNGKNKNRMYLPLKRMLKKGGRGVVGEKFSRREG
jgi:hypothetical protein